MFLEKLGKFLFSNIRPSLFLSLLLPPFFATAFILFHKYSDLQELKCRFEIAQKNQKKSLERLHRKESFLSRYANKNPYFLNQKIEDFPLLQNEKNKIVSMINTSAFPNAEVLNNRLQDLENNHISFIEENTQILGNIKEIEEKQSNPVQMDEEDLKNVLFSLEFEQNDSPQILITDFRLSKQSTSLQQQVFEVEMDLIKREFSTP